MATTPVDPNDDTEIEVGKYIKKGRLLADLTNEITATRPTNNAKLVAERLKIRQVCDYKQQLVDGVQDTSPTGLGGYIVQYVRNNAPDSTELPAADRYLINPNTLAVNRSVKLMRRPGADATHKLDLIEQEKIVTQLATKDRVWKMEGGEIKFTEPADVMINVRLNLGVAFSDVDNGGGTLSWRFSNTGTNRYVIVTAYLLLKGNLSTVGETMKLGLGEVVLFPEDIETRRRSPLFTTTQFRVMDNSGTFGKVESVALYIERSTWVATLGGTMDGVGVFKQTLSGLPDTNNYLEVIEL